METIVIILLEFRILELVLNDYNIILSTKINGLIVFQTKFYGIRILDALEYLVFIDELILKEVIVLESKEQFIGNFICIRPWAILFQ